MLTPDDISQFFKGELSAALELYYDGSDSVIRLELVDKENVIAYIPMMTEKADSAFSIENALIHPMCSAEYTIFEEEYKVEIKKRFQIRSVIKIALSYLGWENEKKMHAKFV